MTTITVALTTGQAEAFAQFYKRTGWSDYQAKAKDDTEAQNMADAVYAIAKELKAAGHDPR